ncbi:ATP-sensitive inward rectifier potassium channel 10 [bacterium]|nr:ATP-sensitive inward rectifier potassium channel 10 [bacterium]
MILIKRTHRIRSLPDRRSPTTVQRVGVPLGFRTDIYLFVIQHSWWVSGLIVGFIFILANALFAFLYQLFPGSVANVNSILDAFFFSVQTMATIGYGAMHPATLAGHILVTIEAAFGIIFVAIATGFMFAKASRPRNSVIFSQPLVINNRFGTPHLLCRFGNARGTDIINAHFTLGVLIDEVTPEGEKIRRLVDLDLVRKHSSFFFVTMTLMHPITETSPFYGLALHEIERKIATIVATVSGHDVTYGQTMHARHYYYMSDIRINHRFKDAVQTDEDGSIRVNYHQFDETEPLES